jgi:hypothetical protein
MAKPADTTEAKKAVKGWLKSDPRPFKTLTGLHAGKVDIYTDAGNEPIYYIVNLQPSGFVIVPADDEVEPIIAFSSGGQYDPSDENPLGALVAGDLPGRIAAVRGAVDKSAGADKAKNKWKQLQAMSDADSISALGYLSVSDIRVSPLVQSKWNQTYACYSAMPCYNYYTPSYWPSGCVATAFAQLLRFYQWPQTAIGALSKSYKINGITYTGYLKGSDGSGAAYNWLTMAFTPNCGTGDTQRAAIGALCWDTGISVGMNYTSGGSSAYTGNIARDLTATFGYSNALYARTVPYETAISAPTLYPIINPNLDAGNPSVLSISGSYGHAVLADGYGYNGSTQYHHLNMGWGGPGYDDYDLWYNLPNINSSPAFNSVMGCVYNIYKTGTGEILSGRVTSMTGSPVQGAIITAVSSGLSPLTATTNSNGIYSFAAMPGSRFYNLSCSKAGMAFDPINNVYMGTSITDSLTVGNKWGMDFVDSLPHPPTAQDGTASTLAGSQITISLNAVDEGLPNPPGILSYIITALPHHGRLTDTGDASQITAAPYALAGSGSNVTYTPCASYVGPDTFYFMANDGGIAPQGGDSNTACVTVTVQLPTPITVYETAFTSGLPAGWSIVDGYLDGYTWTSADFCSRLPPPYGSGTFMIVDSDCSWYVWMDEGLVTQNIDCTSLEQVTLSFNHELQYNSTEIADVDVRTSGGSWENVARYADFTYGPVTLDLSEFADHKPNVQIRWHYYNAYYDWFWSIDDVKITAIPIAESIRGDFGQDCVVDLEDFAAIASAWMTHSGQDNWNPACDISAPADNVIDMPDLAVFADNWLRSL